MGSCIDGHVAKTTARVSRVLAMSQTITQAGPRRYGRRFHHCMSCSWTGGWRSDSPVPIGYGLLRAEDLHYGFKTFLAILLYML